MTAEGGQLAGHVARFVRTLRAAGLAVGPGRVQDAVVAAGAIEAHRRDDFYWALHAVLVSRVEERPVFDEAFRRFWRPAAGEAVPPLLPDARVPAPPPREAARRVAEALSPARPRARPGEAREMEADAPLAWSDREALRHKDFEQLSTEELREAEAAVSALRLPVAALRTRRLRPDARGDRIDARATLRAALRADPALVPLRWRRALRRPPVVVALVDVSGSMSRYARMLLRFLHALARERRTVHAFTFGTRLTAVGRLLRHRDPDVALAAIGRAVPDWDGGTRIGAALREFNLRWSRRVLAQGAVVLLVTDGLDRDDARGLGEEAERLRRSCRRLVWLNPLLRWSGFEPRAAGVRALLPHVDDFRPVHDLESLAQLAAALGRSDPGRASARERR